jgi:hypothetical protein
MDVPKLEGCTQSGGTTDDQPLHWSCQETITRFIVDRPLFALYRDGERKRVSTHCTFWWEQPMSINIVELLLLEDKGDMGDDY